jgi:hypothetical protein
LTVRIGEGQNRLVVLELLAISAAIMAPVLSSVLSALRYCKLRAKKERWRCRLKFWIRGSVVNRPTILNWGSNPTESGEPGSLTAEVARALDNGSRSRITLSGRSTHNEIPAEPREPAR